MKRIILIITINLYYTTGILAQQDHIIQSLPFENVLKAMKTDSVQLFANAFSLRVIDGETNLPIWKDRLEEGKEKFKNYFGRFTLTDFSFKYDRKESKLIVYFKKKEAFGIKVTEEENEWKLDEQ